MKDDCHPSGSRANSVAFGEETGTGSKLEQVSVISGDGKYSDVPTVDQTSGPSCEASTSEKQGPSYKGECCQVQTEPVCVSEQTDGHFCKHKSKRKHGVTKEETPEKHPQPKQKAKTSKHCRDAKFEGTRVPYLVKKRRYHQQNSEQESKAKERSSDDYVLEKLFKKSGNAFDESLTWVLGTVDMGLIPSTVVFTNGTDNLKIVFISLSADLKEFETLGNNNA